MLSLTTRSVIRMTVADDVSDFHFVFGLDERSFPTMFYTSSKVAQLRVDMIQEEVNELQEATNQRDLVEVADALADIVYLCYGAALVYGITLDEVLKEVHRSNMTKLDNGRPVYNERGKVVKGPNYEPPDIQGILDDQSRRVLGVPTLPESV